MTETQITKTETFIDPICGMQVEPATAAGSLNQDGEAYYFCSTGCLQKFMEPTGEKQAGCCTGG